MKNGLLIFLIVFSVQLFGQSKKAQKSFDKARTALKENKLEAALMHLDKALEIDDTYKEAWSMQGDIYFSIDEKEKAEVSYKNAVDNGARSFVRYKLGVTQRENMHYEDAEKTFSEYLDQGNIKPEIEVKVKKFIADCRFAKEAIKNPVKFDVKSMGDLVNTQDYQYHPSISIDGKTLIYTQKDPKKNPSEDFYYTDLVDGVWTEGKKLPGRLNTSLNEGVQTVTAEGTVMYFTICHRQDGRGSCDIYRSELMTNGLWGQGINLGDSINTPQWESQPSVSPDGRTLYFVRGKKSNSKSTAIMVSYLMDNGQWTKAKPMSKLINTKYRESSPFIHFDNQTLYFASDGHPGMGKKDIFVTRRDENGDWGVPVNVGYPINTPAEEFGLVVSSDGRKAFFASDRYSKEERDLNIYWFELPIESRANSVAWIKGKIVDRKTKKPIKTNVNITSLESGQVVTSISSNEKGEYFTVLPANSDYALAIMCEDYLFHSQNFKIKDQTFENAMKVYSELDPIEKGEELILNNVFFDTDSYVLKDESFIELEKLVEFLQSNKNVKIRIDGHTDNEGSSSHNMALSKNRAKAVYNYLNDNGISTSRMSSKGFGDTKPIAGNDTESGRALNRRTVVTIL